MAHIAESCHFYDGITGDPRYTVPNKSKPGEDRPTTLRDAKQFGYVPSVTTILQILDKPQLNRWKQEQVLYASLTMPKGNFTDEQWINAIIEDSKAQSRQAMDLGTEVHAQVQGAYEGIAPAPEYAIYVEAVRNCIKNEWKDYGYNSWIPESSFAHPLRYGGKVDLHNSIAIIDFKTTSLNGEKLKKAGYDEHALQLAAYRLGLKLERASLCNVYISTSVPGEVYLKIWSDEEALWATKSWLALLEFWKTAKKF